MPYKLIPSSRPETWPGECPKCFAIADQPCTNEAGTKIPSIHMVRHAQEFGDWVEIYAKKWRQRVPKWILKLYGRIA